LQGITARIAVEQDQDGFTALLKEIPIHGWKKKNQGLKGRVHPQQTRRQRGLSCGSFSHRRFLQQSQGAECIVQFVIFAA
jgi:hypothetical protein